MKIKICSCGHDEEIHYKSCLYCEMLRRPNCTKFNYKYDAEVGKVESVYQENCDDHGLKVFYVTMKFSNSGQSMQIIIGKKRTKSVFGDMLVKEMKTFFETKDLKNVKNKFCYALRDAGNHNGYIRGILSEPIFGYKNHRVLITREIYDKFGENK